MSIKSFFCLSYQLSKKNNYCILIIEVLIFYFNRFFCQIKTNTLFNIVLISNYLHKHKRNHKNYTRIYNDLGELPVRNLYKFGKKYFPYTISQLIILFSLITVMSNSNNYVCRLSIFVIQMISYLSIHIKNAGFEF